MKALYRQVSDQILEQIASGQRKVGDRLPPESEFAGELGVSRSTVRLAFNRLESHGVLLRRKRAGTEIIASALQPKFELATTTVDELLSIGRDVKFYVKEVTKVQTGDFELLRKHQSEGDQWLEIFAARHLGNDATPFCTNIIYVPTRFAGIQPLLIAPDSTVFETIENQYDVSVGRVKQKTDAVGCPIKEANLIGLEAGKPVLRIQAKLYTQTGNVMQVSNSYCDPARFQIKSDVSVD